MESGEALAILARPIRRADVVLGRWLGFGIVVVAYAMLAGLGEIGAVALTTGYLPPAPASRRGLCGAQGTGPAHVGRAADTRLASSPGGPSRSCCSGSTGSWGWSARGPHPRQQRDPNGRHAQPLIMPTDVAWRGAIASLEPPAALLSSLGRGSAIFGVNPFYAAAAPPADQLAYTGAWIVVGLLLAIALFSRREL